MLDKLKQLYEFQKKAKEVQRELESHSVEASRDNGKIRVIFDGGQKIREVSIAEEWLNAERKSQLERSLKECIAEAIQQSQRLAAGKMKDLTGGMGIPGM